MLTSKGMFQLRHFIVICVFTPLYFVHGQVVNLAFSKTTSSTVVNHHLPSLAVDGNLSQELLNCAHTQYRPRQEVAWWQVDLTVIAEIINITIYYRQSEDNFMAVRRLNGFQITVRMDTNWRKKTPCYSDNDLEYPSNITTIDECKGPGRYVTIFNYHFDALDESIGPLLELCEVQIFVCKTACVNNTFGEGCNSTCHCNQSTCNNSNGQCLKKGCKPGWKGNSCFTQCIENTFGQDCKYTCHCLNGTCNRIHGTCTTPGCKPGYQSKTCSELDSDINISSIPTIVGGLFGALGFILVTVLIITFIFRRRRNAKAKDDANMPQDKPDDVLEHVYHELGPTENTEFDSRFKVTCFQYWPESSSVLACLDYEIILLEEQRRSEFITRKLKVKNTKCCYRNEAIDICMFVTEMRKTRINMVAKEMLIDNLPVYDDTVYKEALLKKNRGKHRNQRTIPLLLQHCRRIFGKSSIVNDKNHLQRRKSTRKKYNMYFYFILFNKQPNRPLKVHFVSVKEEIKMN
ncbi:hypothetical protein KUTeg_021342 [Tegillarca granosa]|uniref:Fucolectin tachylectin-4 pentraxin-1 domain-containing protein n=1 Tax=Tegillarca granosa TaxID=220873 RepID=A0ABQ9EFZ3_TEGGR|nr:hypothetical protein KUTeg_021342 [Tegillarca granosa]